MTAFSHVVGYPITIIEYHSVGTRQTPWDISAPSFRRQLECVGDHFTICRLSELPAILEGTRPPRRTAVLTFDDALSDFPDHAYPILARLGMPATVFVPTAYLGLTNLWDEAAGVPRRSLMSAADVVALHGEGLVEFGSHTARHVRLTAVDIPTAQRELSESRDCLEQLLGAGVTLFAYPYGMPDDIPRRAAHLLKSAGYRAACSSHWGTRAFPGRQFRLRRIRLADADPPAVVLRKVRGLYDWIGVKESVGAARRRLARSWRRVGHGPSQ